MPSEDNVALADTLAGIQAMIMKVERLASVSRVYPFRDAF